MRKMILSVVLVLCASTTLADSFWDHNGSVMRLVANGSERAFLYEIPSQKMINAGVESGSVLFDGHKNGNKYFGTSTIFSKNCYYNLAYKVSGNVYSGPKVVLTGKHSEYKTSNNDCIPTGNVVTDKLVFTYMYSE